ncbi:MAG TPA: outer membrane beta-barrel protein [Rhodoblastus sp.]|nr:outer membrane beta-barrel protein [Rhodoblastus sp.]
MKLKFFAAAFAASVVAGSAFAADLPSRKVAPAYVAPVPVFTWTGLYVGLNVGYGFGGSSGSNGFGVVLPPATAQHIGAISGGGGGLKGILGGGQIGYNYQMGSLVAGIETDIQGAGLRANQQAGGVMGAGNNGAAQFIAVAASSRIDWFGTLRGRLGVAMPSAPNLMLYATGGLAYGNVKQTATPVFVNVTGGSLLGGQSSVSSTKLGWTIGGGFEYAPASMPNWSLKLEYLYTDLGNSTLNLTNAGAAVGGYFACCTLSSGAQTISNRFHTVRAGLNYRFGGVAGPVVAKY